MTACGAPARNRANSSRSSAQRGEAGVMVELDVRQHRDLDLRLSIERSDSSASTTSHSPSPQCGVGQPAADRCRRSASPAPSRRRAARGRASRPWSSCRASPPRRSSAAARVSSASSAARGRSGMPRSRAARRSAFISPIADGVVELDTLARRQVRGAVPDGGLEHPVGCQALEIGAGGAIRAADLGAQRVGRSRVAAHPRAPDADEVQPPAGPGAPGGAHLPSPERCLATGNPPAARSSSAAISAAACGRRRPALPRRHRPQAAAGRPAARRPPRRAARRVSSASGITTAAPPSAIQRGIRALVVPGGMRDRDQHGRQAVSSELEDRAAGAGDDEVGRRECLRELPEVQVRPQVVTARARPRGELLGRRLGPRALVVAPAADVQDPEGRPGECRRSRRG